MIDVSRVGTMIVAVSACESKPEDDETSLTHLAPDRAEARPKSPRTDDSAVL